MSVSVETLIGKLPPYQDTWVQIHPNQSVKHIVDEVMEAHDRYAPYYDNIALYFDADSTKQICNNIYDFLKKNIHYLEEKEDHQTTALPTGLLTRLQGDCKHYSAFTAGVLDALNRSGRKIKWCYRFASYKTFDKIPHHVFVVVNPGASEIWIDPTPGAKDKEPVWFVDKKIKSMPLFSNIAGIGDSNYDGEIQYVNQNGDFDRRPHFQLMGIKATRGADGQHGTNPYFTGPFLGLEHYKEDPYSIEGTDWNITADSLQQQSGIDWDPEFVKWIYENSMKFWNFFEHQGVKPGYTPAVPLPVWYPKLVITADNRLTFDRDLKLDDYMNNEIHAITAWAQDLINTHDSEPFPLKTRDVKLFSQDHTGMPGNTASNLFKEHRGQGFFKEVGKALEKGLNKLKQGVFLISGIGPRAAFLGLVALNVFKYANKLQKHIDQGQWDRIADKWRSLGGTPDKLRKAIDVGKNVPPVDKDGNKIGEPATVATIIAAAAPIVAAMLMFIKDDDGKVNDVLAATKNFFQTMYPEVDLSAFDFIDKNTGKPLQFVVNDEDNENMGGRKDYIMGLEDDPNGGGDVLSWIKKHPLESAAAGGLLFYLLTKDDKKKVSGIDKKILLPIAIGTGIFFLLHKQKNASSGITVEQMRTQLLASDTQDRHWQTVINQMSGSEIITVYDFMINYVIPQKQVPEGSALQAALIAIKNKYQIFT